MPPMVSRLDSMRENAKFRTVTGDRRQATGEEVKLPGHKVLKIGKSMSTRPFQW